MYRTHKAITLAIITAVILFTVGFFISNIIHNNMTLNNEKYFKALKIHDDNNIFKHAIDTDVGYILSNGTVIANEPVSDKLIDGEYYHLEKIEQHYEREMRTVVTMDTNGNAQSRIEHYWVWNTKNQEVKQTDTLNYIGEDFDYTFIGTQGKSMHSTVKDASNKKIRYRFYTIPKEFDMTLIGYVNNKIINDKRLHGSTNINTLLENKEKSADRAVIGFRIFWFMLTIGLSVLIAHLVMNKNKHNY